METIEKEKTIADLKKLGRLKNDLYEKFEIDIKSLIANLDNFLKFEEKFKQKKKDKEFLLVIYLKNQLPKSLNIVVEYSMLSKEKSILEEIQDELIWRDNSIFDSLYNDAGSGFSDTFQDRYIWVLKNVESMVIVENNN